MVHEISVAGGLEGDLHEFKITETGTALVTIYEITSADLSAFGIEAGWIYDCLFQEIDIATGDLLFQWRASDHYKVDETYRPIRNLGTSKDNAFDYFHINSIAKDPAGNYYISARYTHTVTGITPTGDILWILGGKRNQFTDLSGGAATNFSWQHHADWHPNNTITIFDNGAGDSIETADYSRGLMVSLDTNQKTATLLADFVPPQRFLSPSQGSVQILPETGNVFVGWGHSAAYTEYTPDGEVLCDMHFGASLFYSWGRVKSYRAFKSPWVGKPNTAPDIKMLGGGKSVFVSWNGATEVVNWSLQGANLDEKEEEGVETELEFVEVDRTLKVGFETMFVIDSQADEYLRIAALDYSGNVLGYSGILETRTRKIVSITFHLALSLNPTEDLRLTIFFFAKQVSAETLEPLDGEEGESISIQTWILSAGFICGVLLIWHFRRVFFERFSEVYHTPLIRRMKHEPAFQRIPCMLNSSLINGCGLLANVVDTANEID